MSGLKSALAVGGVFAKHQSPVGPEATQPAGTVLLSFEDPLPVEVPAVLIGREDQGFRARHHCPTFRPGQIVAFEDLLAEGRAQVISTEQLEGYVDTRFWVLTD